MKKMFLKSAVLAVAGVGLLAGGAWALPWDSLSSDWTVSGSMDYWTVTDLTTGEDGDSFFQIQLEQASYESGFGLYTVDDGGNIVSKFEVFAPSQEPYEMQNVNFWNDNGDWKITTNYTNDGDLTNDGWVNFAQKFGFYYDVDQGKDGDIDYTFYTDNSLNTAEAGEEHIMTAYNANYHWANVYLDDQIGNGDGDFTDMTVFVNDVAPVPEPATMLLFGTGLAGLAGLRRRKTKKNS